MAIEEKIIENLSSLRKSIGELNSRFKDKIGSLNSIIETAFEDARLIPQFIESQENTLKGINQEISELTEKLSNSKDTIQSVKSEIEIQESTKNDLVVKEEQNRETVNSLDSEIAEFKQRNEQLQLEYDTVKQQAPTRVSLNDCIFLFVSPLNMFYLSKQIYLNLHCPLYILKYFLIYFVLVS